MNVFIKNFILNTDILHTVFSLLSPPPGLSDPFEGEGAYLRGGLDRENTALLIL
jgi:hypothetical protein